MSGKLKKINFLIIDYWLLIISILLITIDLSAQYPGGSRSGGNPFSGGSRGSGGQSLNSQKDASRDTLSQEVFIYYAENAEEKSQFQDSSMLNFHLYDPVRQAEYEHAHLGNLGSAHRQIVFQQRFHKGFDAGFHNYDLYLTKPENIPYYQLEKAYSDIYFSQTNQEKTSFNAKFSKPIGKNAYLGAYYKNIRNEGQYVNQAARANAFSATINYQSKNQKYRSFFSFTTNTIEQKENGGVITTDTFFRKSLLPIGRPVNTQTGDARYFERDINYTQFYLLQKTPKAPEIERTKEDSLRAIVTQPPTAPKDSLIENKLEQVPIPPKIKDKNQPIPPIDRGRRTIPPPSNIPEPQIPQTGRKFTLKHNLSLRKNTYKYVDTDNLSYYGNFIQDDRGVRNFIETSQIENTFSIRTFKLEKGKPGSVFGPRKVESPTQKDLIELGINHLYTKLYQEPIDSNINNVFLFGNIQFTPSERLKINTYGHLGMLKQIGDYYVKGDFLWDTKKLGILKFSLTNQLYSPSLFQQKFIVTQQEVWQNDFKKVLENTLSASYAIPKLKLDFTANYHLIDNYIYQDTLAQPKQFSGGLNIFQLIVNNQIDVGRFHLQNTVYFQQATENIIRFPEIYSIHRLYMDLKLFKVMKTQLGGEVRLNTPYKADNFQPLTSQFFLQDAYDVPFYPVVDVFLNFRIQQFRFFIIMENLYSYATPDFHYTTYPYPAFDPQMRFGFRWLFLD